MRHQSNNTKDRGAAKGTRGTGPSPGVPRGDGTARNRGAEQEDREYRRAHSGGVMLRSAYLTIVGENPDLRPGDRRGAHDILSRINAAIRQGQWTRGEWRRLHQMRRKWEKRAAGRDARFEVVGNKKGGLTKEQRDLIAFRRSVYDIHDLLTDYTNQAEVNHNTATSPDREPAHE